MNSSTKSWNVMTMLHRYRLDLAIVAVLGVVLSASPSSALDWPKRAVTIVVPYGAGGHTDIMARLFAQKMTEKYNQPFVIENRGGASGTIGANVVAKAPADGYTLVIAGAAQTIVMPMLKTLPYDADKDLAPISIFGEGGYILAVRKGLPVSNLKEFIDYVGKRPGEMNYASVGSAAIGHLATVALTKRTGMKMTHVPYNSTMAAGALLNGTVDMYLGSAAEMINLGDQINILATGGGSRMVRLPNVPTLSETVPDLKVTSWNAFFAPAGTPPAIIEQIAKDSAEIAKDPAVAQRLQALGIDAVGSSTSQLVDIIKAEKATYSEAIVAAGLTKE